MKKFVLYLPVIVLGILLLFLLIWRWKVGMTRFFDVDEFSYLHWAANFARGQRPYTDFFLAFTPGFLWFFAPLIAFFSFNAYVFVAARVVSFILFCGMLTFLGILFAATRSKRWALLPVILLAFLPMPYDKFLETRPDNLATLFAFGGLVLEVLAIQRDKQTKPFWFWSGLLYMASLLVFLKTLPFVFVGCIVALGAQWLKKNKRDFADLKAFCLGMGIPFGFFCIWLLTLGDIGKVWYSLIKLPFEANLQAKFGWMEPNLFFFPNGSFYGGTNRVTLSLIINHAIWIVGIIIGAYRCVTPFIGGGGDKRKTLIEVLIGGVFIISVFGYVRFFPLKHSQYLIPIALFIAYYAADILASVFRYIDTKIPLYGVLVLCIIGSYYLGQSTIQVNTVKLGWSNATQIEQMKILISAIPPGSEIFDVEGRLLFWKDAYYICCVPMGSFIPYLSQKPPAIREVLEAKKTPYIYQGDSNRLPLLSYEDMNYIQTNYTPVPGWGDTFWSRKP
jgi:hypothetical protein